MKQTVLVPDLGQGSTHDATPSRMNAPFVRIEINLPFWAGTLFLVLLQGWLP